MAFALIPVAGVADQALVGMLSRPLPWALSSEARSRPSHALFPEVLIGAGKTGSVARPGIRLIAFAPR
jgi:hypothetical protein